MKMDLKEEEMCLYEELPKDIQKEAFQIYKKDNEKALLNMAIKDSNDTLRKYLNKYGYKDIKFYSTIEFKPTDNVLFDTKLSIEDMKRIGNKLKNPADVELVNIFCDRFKHQPIELYIPHKEGEPTLVTYHDLYYGNSNYVDYGQDTLKELDRIFDQIGHKARYQLNRFKEETIKVSKKAKDHYLSDRFIIADIKKQEYLFTEDGRFTGFRQNEMGKREEKAKIALTDQKEARNIQKTDQIINRDK